MQKEQLELERKRQTAQNIASAVSTLVTMAPEARGQYLEGMQQSLGLDMGFLQSLAAAAPTPTAIMMARGMEQAVGGGQIEPLTLAAASMGTDPTTLVKSNQTARFLQTGELPTWIAQLPTREAQDMAISNMAAQASGSENSSALKYQDTAAGVKAGAVVDASTQAQIGSREKLTFAEIQAGNERARQQIGLGYSNLAEERRQGDLNRQSRDLQFLGTLGQRSALAEDSNETKLQIAAMRGKGGVGKGANATGIYANPAYAGMTHANGLHRRTNW